MKVTVYNHELELKDEVLKMFEEYLGVVPTETEIKMKIAAGFQIDDTEENINRVFMMNTMEEIAKRTEWTILDEIIALCGENQYPRVAKLLKEYK